MASSRWRVTLNDGFWVCLRDRLYWRSTLLGCRREVKWLVLWLLGAKYSLRSFDCYGVNITWSLLLSDQVFIGITDPQGFLENVVACPIKGLTIEFIFPMRMWFSNYLDFPVIQDMSCLMFLLPKGKKNVGARRYLPQETMSHNPFPRVTPSCCPWQRYLQI